VPVLVDNVTDAKLFLVQTWVTDTNAPLAEGKPWLLRTTVGNVTASEFLGGSGYGDSQEVIFTVPAPDTQGANIQWSASVPDTGTGLGARPQVGRTGPPVFYGVPYTWTLNSNRNELAVGANHQTLITTPPFSGGGLGGDPGQNTWLFIPSKPVYRCERSTGLCVSTSGFDNLFEQIRCQPHQTSRTKGDPTNGFTCTNRFQEPVHFSNQRCVATCGLPGSVAGGGGAGTQTVALTPTLTPAPKPQTPVARQVLPQPAVQKRPKLSHTQWLLLVGLSVILVALGVLVAVTWRRQRHTRSGAARWP